jgi:hypothetical protein
MTYRKLLWILAVVALLLTLLLLRFIPWEALVTLLFLLGIMVSPIVSQLLQIAKARLTPIPQYQPSSEIPPEPTYVQGYQAQTPSSTSWSSRTPRNDQPKQDPPGAWDQPQVQHPEQVPPLQ